MKEFEGRVAIVTGAGSLRGMGRAIALALAERGADVVVSDVARPASDAFHDAFGYHYGADRGLEATAQAVEDAGARAVAVRADVAEPGDVERLVAEAVRAFGRLDMLANVAGGAWGVAQISDADPELWMHTLKVNLFGVFLTTKYAIPHLAAQGRGAIVNISSLAAERAGPGTSAYGASKAGVVSFTRTTALEYARYGVRANALLPGDIETDLLDLQYRATAAVVRSTPEEVARQAAANTPLGRLGLPRDVAELAAFLCSERASFLTGLAIPVAGGVGLA